MKFSCSEFLIDELEHLRRQLSGCWTILKQQMVFLCPVPECTTTT